MVRYKRYGMDVTGGTVRYGIDGREGMIHKVFRGFLLIYKLLDI